MRVKVVTYIINDLSANQFEFSEELGITLKWNSFGPTRILELSMNDSTAYHSFERLCIHKD